MNTFLKSLAGLASAVLFYFILYLICVVWPFWCTTGMHGFLFLVMIFVVVASLSGGSFLIAAMTRALAKFFQRDIAALAVTAIGMAVAMIINIVGVISIMREVATTESAIVGTISIIALLGSTCFGAISLFMWTNKE